MPKKLHRRVVDTLKDIEGVEVFVDDIFVHCEGQKQHDESLAAICKKLARAGFKVNDAKCHISKITVKFLGHIISEGCLLTNPEILKSVHEFSEPQTQSQMESFLGLVAWLKKFYPDHQYVTAPSRNLTKSLVTWNLAPTHSEAFKAIKKKMTENVSLELFDDKKTVELWIDANPFGLGVVLYQNKKPCTVF